MADTIIAGQDSPPHQPDASPTVSEAGQDAFTIFDAKIHGARFAELIGAYWCEVAVDLDDVENPKYPNRRKINPRQEWKRLHEYEYIRFNTPKFADMIVLDVDAKDSGALAPGSIKARMKQVLEIANAMPVKPMMVGLNPAPGKRSFQMIWHMDKPAYESGWERDLFNVLQDAITRLFGGDPNFNGSLSRNPLSLTNQSDGYIWWYSDWEPRTWYEMNLHYALEAFDDFEQVHEDILEQEVRIATAEKLFEPDRDGRKAKKRAVVLTFDADGKVNRRTYIFKKSAADAGSLMFTGQPVTAETVYPLVVAASEDAYAVDPRIDRPDERYLRRTAKYVAEWVNDKMIPGGGRELRYRSNSKYTRSQASLGGQRVAVTNMASGRFLEETAPKGRAKISSNKAERYIAIQQAYLGLSPEIRAANAIALLVDQFEVSPATIRNALDDAGLRETKQGAGAHGRRSTQTRFKSQELEADAPYSEEEYFPERPSRRRRPRREHEAEARTSIRTD
ncbi:replication initiation protein [Microbacterium sp. ASV81]|uniref:Replication initiation protein n=1 Tax=Microbacterium capsulatum TaxID=3041921 RepID=A0ABU0XFZ3_9MICO|nr:replication initiation protein [Microbacterium sp. ASV81]MDQ4214045.1 replication initiation protein [Microbacterium sp. ASV81]